MNAKQTDSPKNKSDGGWTSDAFWRSARVLVSELSFKWYSFMFLGPFRSFVIKILDFSENHECLWA